MSRTSRLVVVQTEPVVVDGSVVRIATKSYEGLARYARLWPGEVVVVARSGSGEDLPRLVTSVPRGELPFAIEVAEDASSARARRSAAVTLAFHRPEQARLLDRDARRVVLFGEFPVAERIRSGTIDAPLRTRARVRAGWWRRSGLLRRMVTASGGFQANGYPAWEAYRAASPDPMLYFDTRVTAEVHARGERPTVPDPGPGREALRLGFSGRHIPAKGADHAVRAVVRAVEQGTDARLDVFGSGPLTPRLREQAAVLGDRVRFRGELPFRERWVDAVLDDVDVMILPHRQGDPSGTYLESAALGIPVLGYANRALEALVDRHGIGWTVPMDDVAALAAATGRLARDRGGRRAAGAAGRSFMAGHLFEEEFARRVRHLRRVADR